MNTCSLQDFDWIEVRQNRDPYLETAIEHKFYYERWVPMQVRDGRNILIICQVCAVWEPIMNDGKFRSKKRHDRWATFTTRGGVSCGMKLREKRRWTESKITQVGMLNQTWWRLQRNSRKLGEGYSLQGHPLFCVESPQHSEWRAPNPASYQ